MTGFFEAVLTHLVFQSGAKLKDLAVGKEMELRTAIREALLLAVNDSGLPEEMNPSWVVDCLFEGRLTDDESLEEVGGMAGNGPLEIDSPDFARRLNALMPHRLERDLTRLGVDLTAVFDAFGVRFRQVVRAAGARASSSLSDLASRIEAETLYGAADSIAHALGINLGGTRDTLRRMREESRQRVFRRLDALTVPEERFEELIGVIQEIPAPELSSTGLLLLAADSGSGKSTIAERIHAKSIDDAETDPAAPLPVFIEAKRLRSDIESEVARIWAIDTNVSIRGVDLVLDGVEEVGLNRGRELLLDLRSSLRSPLSPLTRAIVTTRPLDYDVEVDHKIAVELLSNEKSTELMSELAGRPVYPYSYPNAIRGLMQRPFYAIALGLDFGSMQSYGLPSASTVIESVARRALRDSNWEDSSELLSRVAVDSVNAAHGAVSMASLRPEEKSALERTTLVRVDDQNVYFDVTLIAEWFAAQYVLANPTLISGLIEDPERLQLWRYPLLLALESAQPGDFDSALGEMSKSRPAFTGWLLSQRDPFAWQPGDDAREVSTPGSRVMALRLRQGMKDLGEGLETWSTSSVYFNSGRLLPMALSTAEGRCLYAWHRDDVGVPEVIDQFPDVESLRPGQGWLSVSDVSLSDHPSWPWRHAHHLLSEALQNAIKAGSVFAGGPHFEQEHRWIMALNALGRRNSIGYQPIDRDELSAVLRQRDEVLAQLGITGARDDAKTAALRALLEDLIQEQVSVLEPPWDVPDQLYNSGGWVWGAWSSEALLARAERATKYGLELYEHAVNGPLRHFASQLRIASSLPVRVRGVMQPANMELGFGGAPNFLWYIDRSAQETGADWQLVQDAQPVARALYEMHVDRWHMHELHGIYRSGPAIEFAKYLLWQDLSEWGWTKGTLPNT